MRGGATKEDLMQDVVELLHELHPDAASIEPDDFAFMKKGNLLRLSLILQDLRDQQQRSREAR